MFYRFGHFLNVLGWIVAIPFWLFGLRLCTETGMQGHNVAGFIVIGMGAAIWGIGRGICYIFAGD